ncbi:MAG: hypothetical protein AMJ84_00070 [Acidithiobacillales bacterium SM23_46]|nr:MAG: hypothetical protein AMJ84_00070 [Acidithiobacillales bacterium SM23_46]KPL28986.1 MAG: hypothetical protein AMJ72_00045 [Acidithiobacillales bacterium SM1_46]
MRTLKPFEYQLDRETWEEQRAAGRYNPATVVIWRGHRYAIGAGTGDDLDLFEEGGALYVLARRDSLGYAGLEVFRDGERIADTFTDYEEQAEYINGLSAIYAAKRLANWCDAEGGEAYGYDY